MKQQIGKEKMFERTSFFHQVHQTLSFASKTAARLTENKQGK